jgi:hypothetical protein
MANPTGALRRVLPADLRATAVYAMTVGFAAIGEDVVYHTGADRL